MITTTKQWDRATIELVFEVREKFRYDYSGLECWIRGALHPTVQTHYIYTDELRWPELEKVIRHCRNGVDGTHWEEMVREEWLTRLQFETDLNPATPWQIVHDVLLDLGRTKDCERLRFLWQDR